MAAAKDTTLKEVGEMLTHVVESMATKEDVAKLDTRIDDLRTGYLPPCPRSGPGTPTSVTGRSHQSSITPAVAPAG